MDYLDFHALNEEPFSNAPVSRFYFESEQHDRALTRLRYALSSMKGLALLVGGVGAGKTTLARRLLDSLDEREFEAALLVIIHSGVTADWLLHRIAVQLGVREPAKDKLAILGQLYQRLIEIYEAGKKAVVLIDEAQMLATQEIMEEFRGLLNLEVPERKLLSFVFFGLPEVEQHLKIDPPLAQRVAMVVRLDSLDVATTRRYVEHRLRVAGATAPIFDDAALDALAHAARGVPRVINTIADNCLFEAALAKARTLGADVVESVAKNLGLVEPPKVAVGKPVGPPVPIAPTSSAEKPSTLPPPPPLPDETRSALDEIDRVLAQLQFPRPTR